MRAAQNDQLVLYAQEDAQQQQWQQRPFHRSRRQISVVAEISVPDVLHLASAPIERLLA